MVGVKGFELVVGLAILVVSADNFGKSLPNQDIIQGRFHRKKGMGLGLSMDVIQCGGKCTQDMTCGKFIYDPRRGGCRLFSATEKVLTRRTAYVYMRTGMGKGRGRGGGRGRGRGHCPTEKNYVWNEDAQLCYRFETRKWITWHAAEIKCNADNGHLIKLDTSAKNDFIAKEARKLENVAGRIAYSIGLSNLKKNGDWTWYDSTSVSIPRWGPNKPNGDGNCVQIHSDMSYKWNDIDCMYRWRYICEI